MKNPRDLVRGWLLKAESDLSTVELCLASQQAFDVGCFHAQQAIEKFLKAYLIHNAVEFAFTHDLNKLLEQCASVDGSFRSLLQDLRGITEYAVELRYDPEFWPPLERLRAARDAALEVKAFVLARLPGDLLPGPQNEG